MGVAIRAAIVIGTAAAVYGIAKLRDTSKQAAKAVDEVNAAGKKAAKIKVPDITPESMHSKVSNARGFRKKVQLGVRNALFGKVESNPEISFKETPEYLKTKAAIAATNAMSGVAREARNWYRLLNKEIGKSSGKGLRSVEKATLAIARSAEKAQDGYSSLSATVGSLVAVLGGTALLGGAGGFVERSFGLARAKEDARITFDTLLGSRELTDELLGGITKYAAQTPFQKADIVAASKRMLVISGKDVKENERLYKLAGQIAALKPGTSVEEVSQGIISGSFGEFEILKGLTFKLNAAMFKGAGQSGGKEYGQAVIKEIERQLAEKTGGRDLVLALSTSLTGLMSTVKDSVEEPLTELGEYFIKNLGIKTLLQDYITQATLFADYFSSLLKHGASAIADPNMASGVKMLAIFASEMAAKFVFYGNKFITFGKYVMKTFNELSPRTQSMVLNVGALASAFSVAAGVIAPLIAGVVALGSLMWGPISAVTGLMTAVTIKFGALLATVAGFGTAFVSAGIFTAFMVFRQDGESLLSTLDRLGKTVGGFLYNVFANFSKVIHAAWVPLNNALLPAWQRLEVAFGTLRPYFQELAVLFGATTVDGELFAQVGSRIGDAMVWVLNSMVSLIETGIDGVRFALEVTRPHFKFIVSDIKRVGSAILEFLAGTASAGVTAKTLFAGFVDIVTFPFRLIIEKFHSMTAEALASAAETVRPFSALVAGQLEAAAKRAKEAAASVSEGFLKNRDGILGQDSSLAVKIEGNIASAAVPIQLNIDGERVAETQARVGMRARNSGRGGDPMSPEEMGFVINDGRIRTVDLSSVAAQGD